MGLQSCAVDKPCRTRVLTLQADRGVEPGTPLGDIAARLTAH